MPGQACCLLNDGHSDGHSAAAQRHTAPASVALPHSPPQASLIPQWGGAQCLPKQQGGEIKSHGLCGG